jgi:hypothetical protein
MRSVRSPITTCAPAAAMVLTAITTTFIAPRFVNVEHVLRQNQRLEAQTTAWAPNPEQLAVAIYGPTGARWFVCAGFLLAAL